MSVWWTVCMCVACIYVPYMHSIHDTHTHTQRMTHYTHTNEFEERKKHTQKKNQNDWLKIRRPTERQERAKEFTLFFVLFCTQVVDSQAKKLVVSSVFFLLILFISFFFVDVYLFICFYNSFGYVDRISAVCVCVCLREGGGLLVHSFTQSQYHIV